VLTGTFENGLPRYSWHILGVGNDYRQNLIRVAVQEVFNFLEVTLDCSAIEETLQGR
jgi:hypothetical protein